MTEIAYSQGLHISETDGCRIPSYGSASLEGLYLQPEESILWKQAVADAENSPAAGQLLDFLRDIGDRFTAEHSDRVGMLNAAIAVRLGMPPEIVRDAAISGFVHDVGKLYFQDIIHIDGKLTDEQYEEVKLHAPRGAQMVAARGLRRALIHATGNHHGYQRNPYPTYPEALYRAGDIGPLSPDHIIGTGLAVADVYDAMRSARPGRKQPLPMPVAMEAIGGLQVPSDVKAAFRSLFSATVELANAA